MNLITLNHDCWCLAHLALNNISFISLIASKHHAIVATEPLIHLISTQGKFLIHNLFYLFACVKRLL